MLESGFGVFCSRFYCLVGLFDCVVFIGLVDSLQVSVLDARAHCNDAFEILGRAGVSGADVIVRGAWVSWGLSAGFGNPGADLKFITDTRARVSTT